MYDGLEQGRVLDCTVEESGSVLAADYSGGATVLQVVDSSDFSDSGGTVTINGSNYTYTSKDSTLDTITLSTGLLAAAVADDDVLLYPPSEEKWALVDLASEEDAVEARVPHSLYDKIPEGVRDEADIENVLVRLQGGDWVITEILGQRPSVSGSYIDLGSTGDFSAVDEPPSSPAIKVSGNATSLVVEVTGVLRPSDRLKFYVSTTEAFTPASTDLVAETRATVLVINKMPNGDDLLPNTPYFVRAWATNDIGDAPTYSPDVSDTLHTDVLATTVMARLVAGFILTGEIQIGAIRISAEEGIVVGDYFIHIPADGSTGTIASHLIARSLNIQDNFTLNGVNNQVYGLLVLGAGIVAPENPPTLGQGWPKYTIATSFGENIFQGIFTAPWDSTKWVLPFCFFGMGVRTINKSNFDWSGDLTISGMPSQLDGFQPWGGMVPAVGGSGRYMAFGIGPKENIEGGFDSWWLVTFTYSAGVLTYVNRLEVATASNFTNTPRLSWDGSTYFYIWYFKNQNLRVIRVNDNNPITRDTSVVVEAYSQNYDLGGAYTGTADFGAVRHVLHRKGSDPLVYSGNPVSSPTKQANDTFKKAGTNCYGLTWDGTRFWMLSAVGTDVFLYKHSINKGESGKTTYTVEGKGTWYDGNATGGTHETDASTQASTEVDARAWPRFEMPNAPDTNGDPGDNDKADMIGVYLCTGAANTPRWQAYWGVTTRNVSSVVTAAASKVLTAPNADSFSSDDLGAGVSGTNIPAGAVIESIGQNGRTAVMDVDATGAGTITLSVVQAEYKRSGLFDSINNAAASPPGSNGFLSVTTRAPGSLASIGVDAVGDPVIELLGSGAGRAGHNKWDKDGKSPWSGKLSTNTNNITTSTWTTRQNFSDIDGTNWPGVLITPTTGVFTITEKGLYVVSGVIGVAGGGSGRRVMRALLDGATVIYQSEHATNSGTVHSMPFSFIYPFAAGATVEIQAWQNSGGNIAWAGGDGQSLITIARVHS